MASHQRMSDSKEDSLKSTQTHMGVVDAAEHEDKRMDSNVQDADRGDARREASTEDDREREKELERKLVRKIDLRLLPILVVLYMLNYLDRNAPSAARLSNFQTDLGLSDPQYNSTLSILYVGYILMQVPSNLILAKYRRPRIQLPICVAIWGTISGLTALTHDFGQIMAVRIALGTAEAVFFPASLFILSSWYTRRELTSRMALLYSGSILSNAVSGLISAGILGNMDGKAGIAGWRWLFIIEGSLTVFFAILAFFILPDFPANDKLLSDAERELAVRRMREDSGQTVSDEGTARQGFILAIKDPKVWILTFLLTSAVIAVSFNAFFPSIVQSLGYTKTTTLLITFGPWAFAWICVLLNSLHADKVQERCFHLCIPFAIGILGFIIASATHNVGSRMFAMFIMASSYAGYVIILSWIAGCVPRPTYKRAAALAFINAFSQLGNIAGSYVWPSGWGPSYWRSSLIAGMCAVLTILLALGLRMYLQHLNRQLDQIAPLQQNPGMRGPASRVGAPAEQDHVAKVLTDVEHQDVGTESQDSLAKLDLERALMARSQFRYLL